MPLLRALITAPASSRPDRLTCVCSCLHVASKRHCARRLFFGYIGFEDEIRWLDYCLNHLMGLASPHPDTASDYVTTDFSDVDESRDPAGS